MTKSNENQCSHELGSQLAKNDKNACKTWTKLKKNAKNTCWITKAAPNLPNQASQMTKSNENECSHELGHKLAKNDQTSCKTWSKMRTYAKNTCWMVWQLQICQTKLAIWPKPIKTNAAMIRVLSLPTFTKTAPKHGPNFKHMPPKFQYQQILKSILNIRKHWSCKIFTDGLNHSTQKQLQPGLPYTQISWHMQKICTRLT